MPHHVTTIINNVELTDGNFYPTSGTDVLLTDAQFALLTADDLSNTVSAGAVVAPAGDAVVTQGTNVAAVGALTSTVAAGNTLGSTVAATNPATKVEFDALRTDVSHIITSPTKVEFDALRVDVAAIRTQLNAALAALTGSGKPMHT